MINAIDFVPGDTVKVYQKIVEGDKSRIQSFQGVVLGIKGRGENKSFTVRRTFKDIAVERIWQVKSPNIQKIEIKEHAKKKAKRAKLYYLRKK